MAAPTKAPEILAVNPDGIPQYMRGLKRWGVWEATWKPERGKYDKKPIHPVTGAGLSILQPEQWVTFDQAWKAYQEHPERYAGLGFLITKSDGITCVDLDKCMPGGAPDVRALDVIGTLESFTEVSPSGEGAHIWLMGTSDFDCSQGIEVYSGHGARYVTVTGTLLPGAPDTLRAVPKETLHAIIDTYGQRPSASNHQDMPDILDDLALPDIDTLDLPYEVRDYLLDGDRVTDRSSILARVAFHLQRAGLSPQEAYSVMATNTHCMADAMDKRRQDEDRALELLWRHEVNKTTIKAQRARITMDDFDLEGPPPAPAPAEPTSGFSVDDFDNVADPATATPPKKFKFAPLQAAAYSSLTKPLRWFVQGVLPRAELGVLFGESGAGKSFLAMDLVMAVARKVQWRGKKVNQGRVVYVVAEGSIGFKYRLDAYAEYHDANLSEVPFYAIPASPNLMDKGDTKELIEAINSVGPVDLVVLDTLAQVTPGADENSGQDMGRALAHCKAIHRATGAMVLLVAHTGKDTTRGIRGWSGIKGALDVELQVERSGKQRAVTITKLKDGSGEGVEYGFTLDIVEVGERIDPDDGEIEKITSCVVKHGTAQSVDNKPEKLARQEHRDALEKLQELFELAGVVPLATALDTIAGLQQHAEAKVRNRAAKRILSVLARARHVSVENDEVKAVTSA